MLLLNQNWLAFVSVACIKMRFFSRPNLITYKAYVTSQKCALMHDSTAHVCAILNMNNRMIIQNIQSNFNTFQYNIRL